MYNRNITANKSNKFPVPLGEVPTIDCLDASAVVVWELEVFCFKPLVEGGHDGGGVVGVLQTQSMTQLVHSHQEDIITFRQRDEYNLVCFHFFQDLHVTVCSSLSLTPLVGVPGGPGLSEVKVSVSSDAVSREVSVSQEAALAVKRCAVAVETIREREHDVGELVGLASDLAVGDLSEGERDHTLPHLKGFSDGVIRGSLPDLWGVVLYAVQENTETGVEA